MFTQKFIKIFHSVQEIGPFSLFQNLALGKASTDDKCHFAIPWARSFQHQIVCKILSKCSKRLLVNFLFFFFQNLNLGKTSTNPICHLTISWASSCRYTNVYANFHHNIPLSSRVIFTFSEFGARQKPRPMKNDISQSLGLDLDNINVYAKVYQNIPLSSRDRAIFTFSEFGARQSLDR